MAGGDYRLCDVCEGKAFYDACLSYEYDGEFDPDQDPPYKVAGQDESCPMRLSRLGDWAVLCVECAKTNETRIVERRRGRDGMQPSRAVWRSARSRRVTSRDDEVQVWREMGDGVMSDRLSDAEMAALREHLRTERERNNGVPTLTWAEVDALLDEVQEARENRGKVLAYDLDQAGIQQREREAAELVDARARIAELEAELEDQNRRLNEYTDDHDRRMRIRAERIAELEAQVERIQTDREAWARRSRQQYDRIGRALYPVRQKRASGEPSRDDATEIECLVRRIAELEHANREMRQALESGEADSAESEHVAHLQRKIDQLQAQLANLRRTIESWSDRGMVLVSDVLAELDEVGIPTDWPEAEEDGR